MFLTYFLALERFKVHLVMTIVSGILVSLLIFMIAAVDHPFRGGVSIGPTPSDSFTSSSNRSGSRRSISILCGEQDRFATL